MTDNLIRKTRHYKFTQKELKKALGIKGDLSQSGLWEWQSPHDEEIESLKTNLDPTCEHCWNLIENMAKDPNELQVKNGLRSKDCECEL